jgi:hypothetical protein
MVNFYRNGLLYLRTYNRNESPYPLSLELAESKKFELNLKCQPCEWPVLNTDPALCKMRLCR